MTRVTLGRFLGLCVVSVAAVALIAGSSAAFADAQGAAAIDVSTRAAVVDYLRSIHIDPRGVVIERGLRNYAGANCPGAGWTCTATTHPVVQVAAAGGSNTFRCTTASCVVVQIANARASGTNLATCIKTGGSAQTCTINQASPSKNNKAVVYQNIAKTSGLTQSFTSTVTITQKATGSAVAPNLNEACVYQSISLDRSGTIKSPKVILVQNAHQSVTIKQDSANGGNLAAESATPQGACTLGQITQRQTLHSILTVPKLIKQRQNAGTLTPNVIINIKQNRTKGFLGIAHGQNTANFDQYTALTAVANSPNGRIGQTQSSAHGGLLGTINQDSRDVSTAVATQTEIQCEDGAQTGLTACDSADSDSGQAPTLTQNQFGPVHKGSGISKQTGNAADSFSIYQSSTQDDDSGPGSHQTNDIQGDCSTNGNCQINQSTDINGVQTSNSASGQNVQTSLYCQGVECSGP
jgi:hypothetical protein